MKLPGILPLAFFLFLVPALVPVIERFWPTATTWWSAILVTVLGAAVSAGWLIYRKQLAKVDMPAPMATPIGQVPDDEDMTYTTPKPQPTPFVKTWLLG